MTPIPGLQNRIVKTQETKVQVLSPWSQFSLVCSCLLPWAFGLVFRWIPVFLPCRLVLLSSLSLFGNLESISAPSGIISRPTASPLANEPCRSLFDGVIVRTYDCHYILSQERKKTAKSQKGLSCLSAVCISFHKKRSQKKSITILQIGKSSLAVYDGIGHCKIYFKMISISS